MSDPQSTPVAPRFYYFNDWFGILDDINEIIVRQASNMQSCIVFGGINVIGRAIIVYKKIHVACHLAAIIMRTQYIKLDLFVGDSSREVIFFCLGFRN